MSQWTDEIIAQGKLEAEQEDAAFWKTLNSDTKEGDVIYEGPPAGECTKRFNRPESEWQKAMDRILGPRESK